MFFLSILMNVSLMFREKIKRYSNENRITKIIL